MVSCGRISVQQVTLPPRSSSGLPPCCSASSSHPKKIQLKYLLVSLFLSVCRHQRSQLPCHLSNTIVFPFLLRAQNQQLLSLHLAYQTSHQILPHLTLSPLNRSLSVNPYTTPTLTNIRPSALLLPINSLENPTELSHYQLVHLCRRCRQSAPHPRPPVPATEDPVQRALLPLPRPQAVQ